MDGWMDDENMSNESKNICIYTRTYTRFTIIQL